VTSFKLQQALLPQLGRQDRVINPNLTRSTDFVNNPG